MLRSAYNLIGYKTETKTQALGKIEDLYFDEESWTIRFLVIGSIKWFSYKKILLSPEQITKEVKKAKKFIFGSLNRKEIKKAPDINTAKPVSREKEMGLLRYYRLPTYWQAMPEGNVPPLTPPPLPHKDELLLNKKQRNKSHLRSLKKITKYRLKARNTLVGTVKDLIIDEKSMKARYLAIKTSVPLSGRSVLIAPDWIRDISWAESKMYTDIEPDKMENCPTYDPREGINRTYEQNLYDYYGRPRYWVI